jgi:NhaP-type Na+/H+ or K+/H+ antiporter
MRRHPLTTRTKKLSILALAIALALLAGAAPALAQTNTPTLSGVIDNLRNVVVGLLAGLATLFLTVGGLRYMSAAGDPSQVERAKVALRSAAVGYGLAILAPLLVGILKSVVGG